MVTTIAPRAVATGWSPDLRVPVVQLPAALTVTRLAGATRRG